MEGEGEGNERSEGEDEDRGIILSINGWGGGIDTLIFALRHLPRSK